MTNHHLTWRGEPQYQGGLPTPYGAPPAPLPPESQDTSPRQAFGVLRRHLVLIGSCVVVALGAAAAVVKTTTPVYETTATLQIDPKEGSLPEVYRSLQTGTELATGMEVLRSRSLAEGVVDSLALRFEVAEPARVPRERLFTDIAVAREAAPAAYTLTRGERGTYGMIVGDSGRRVATVRVGEPARVEGVSFTLTPAAGQYARLRLSVRRFDDAVAAMRRSLAVERSGRETNVVQLSYESTDPVIARDVLNSLTGRFVRRRSSVQKTEARSTATFLAQQIDTLSRELTSAENELRDFRERERVVNPEVEGSTQVTRLAQLQSERGALEAERQALAKLLNEAALEKPAADSTSPYRRLLGFPSLFKNQAVSTYLSSLTQAEDQRVALLTRRTAQDPDVIALTNRVRELESQLRATTETYLQGLTAQVAAQDAELARAGSRLGTLPAKEVQYARLQRGPKVLADMLTMLQTRLKEAQIAEAMEDPSVQVLDAAIVPRRPVRPRPIVSLGLAGVVGLLLGVALAFVREQLDRSIHTRHEVQRTTGVPVLGLIPRINDATGARAMAAQRPFAKLARGSANGNGKRGRSSLVTMMGGGGASAGRQTPPMPADWSQALEGYARLHVNLMRGQPNVSMKTVVFTSPLAGDGKTTTATNFALALCRRGHRVLLIDADVRRGTIHTLLDGQRSPGLTGVLDGSVAVEQALRVVELPGAAPLHVITSGEPAYDAGALFSSAALQTLLTAAARDYDTIVLDTPPLNLVSDAALLSSRADGVVLVVRAGVTTLDALSYTVEQLRAVGAPVIGAVLNDVDFKRDGSYDGAYAYYGNYAYGAPQSGARG